MSKIQTFKRIISEDFPEDQRALVSKLSYSINVFAEDVQNALNKGISIDDNLSSVKKLITVTVDALGNPTIPTSIKSNLSGTCSGIQVIKATNLDVPGTYPTGTPFISFTDNSGLINIINITNLQANNRYQLRIILFD